MTPCPVCAGKGKVTIQNANGVVSIFTCDACAGSGNMPSSGGVFPALRAHDCDLRDLFAASVVTGLLSMTRYDSSTPSEKVAVVAYEIADAMMVQRGGR